MNKNKLVMRLSLTILIAFLGGGLAHAKSSGRLNDTAKTEQSITEEGDQIPSKNSRQKTPNSTRKAAALRLKAEYQQQKAVEIANDREEHVRGQNQQGGAK